MTIQPGRGTEPLHLKQATRELRSRFGAPQRKQNAGAIRVYWIYPNHHFECMISKRSSRVLSLFLQRGSDLLDPKEFSYSEQDLRAKWGEPSNEGGGFRIATGKFVGRWLTYDQGLGFHFDEQGQIETISVFAPKRTNAKKLSVSRAHSAQSQQIAALRLR